ncbi:unnamed protein product [Pedinophyceae sp. YPF-701]|nr:unnamed protein product [Pedinophyceae sp. YPF-701]
MEPAREAMPQMAAAALDTGPAAAALAMEADEVDLERAEEELLQHMTNEDLLEATFIEFAVDAGEMNLPRMLGRLPALVSLRLNGSMLTSMRDLGTKLTNLRVLWVARCGLESLDGISSLPCLTELYAAFNSIADVSKAAECQDLAVLDLEGNSVDSWDEVAFLGMCRDLQSLCLQGNPISSHSSYRSMAVQQVPSLVSLDDIPVADEERVAQPGGAACVSEAGEHQAGGNERAAADEDEDVPVQQELQLISDGLRFARVGIDSPDVCAPNWVPPTRSASRMLSSAGSMTSSAQRPSTARAGLEPAKPVPTRSGSSGLPPRPGTAATVNGAVGTGSNRPPSAQGGLFWRKNRLRESHSAGSQGDTGDGSMLTMGGALAGGAGAALRQRRANAAASNPEVVETFEERDLEPAGLLDLLRRIKVDLLHTAGARRPPSCPEVGGHLRSGSPDGSASDAAPHPATRDSELSATGRSDGSSAACLRSPTHSGNLSRPATALGHGGSLPAGRSSSRGGLPVGVALEDKDGAPRFMASSIRDLLKAARGRSGGSAAKSTAAVPQALDGDS